MLKVKAKSRNIDESQLFHTKYNCLYHIVFIFNLQLNNSV